MDGQCCYYFGSIVKMSGTGIQNINFILRNVLYFKIGKIVGNLILLEGYKLRLNKHSSKGSQLNKWRKKT